MKVEAADNDSGGRFLIVNADDFGYSSGVNRGIVEAHERGIVTSSSLMVDQPGADEAAAYARTHEALSLGLHVELRRWRPSRLSLRGARKSARRLQVQAEADLRRQLERFRSLTRRDPTHLDSHHHRHRLATLRPLFLDVADELRIPLRQFDGRIHFCGDFYGQLAGGHPNRHAIEPQGLIALLGQLPPGVTELCCHPGYDDGLNASYRSERKREVATLCDASVREALERLDIRLISFGDVCVAD